MGIGDRHVDEGRLNLQSSRLVQVVELEFLVRSSANKEMLA